MPWLDESEKLAMRPALISLILYLAIAGAFTAYFGGGTKTFAEALGVLIGARFFFAAVEGIGSVLTWHLYLRKSTIQMYLRVLREQKFPPRYYKHDDFLAYLDRVQNDVNCPERLRWEAKAIESMLAMYESMGVLVGARQHSASEIALEAYSARAQAPDFEAT